MSSYINAQMCSAGFTYSKELYRCPPNYKCLVADNITVTFKADNTTYKEYSWDFGDGTTGKGLKVFHQYFKPGEYKVTLKIFTPSIGDGSNVYHVICEDSVTKVIKIENQLDAPVVQPTCEIKPTLDMNGNNLTFNDNRPYEYRTSIFDVMNYWTFGDGTASENMSGSHRYNKPGKYLVTLHTKVFNNMKGQTEGFCQSLSYDSLLKTHIPCYYKELCNASYSFWVETKDCDLKPILTVKGNTLSYYDGRVYLAAEGVRKHEDINFWTFGDGTSASEFFNTHSPYGLDHNMGTGTHTYKKPGRYLVTLYTGSFYNPLLDDMKGKGVCLALTYDSLLHTYIPCYYGEICRGKYQMWIEIPGDTAIKRSCNADIQISKQGNTITGGDAIITTAVVRPEIIHYFWSFGDGRDTTGKFVTHTYRKSGKYLVSVTKVIFDNSLTWLPDAGNRCDALTYDETIKFTSNNCLKELCRETYTQWIEIEGDSVSNPLCDFDLQIEQYGQTLKGSIIDQPYVMIYAKDYLWSFGDGSDTTGYSISHQYKKPGRYLVSATTITYSLPLKEICRETKSQWVDIKNLIMNLSPNPMDNSGSISIENASQPVEFNIYNYSGLLVKSFKGLDNGKLDFPTHDLPIGIYLYTVESGGELIKKDKFSVLR